MIDVVNEIPALPATDKEAWGAATAYFEYLQAL
jgi:hypothetical protein